MIIRREKRLLRVQLKLIKQTEQRYIITYYNIHLNEESRSFRLQKKKKEHIVNTVRSIFLPVTVTNFAEITEQSRVEPVKIQET